MNGSSAAIVVVITVVVVAGLGFFGRKRGPKERFFKCSRCSTVANHTSRTIEAWRSGKTKLFCNACHTQWLRSQPAQSHGHRISNSPRGGGSGCLGSLMLVALPIVAAWVWWT